MLAIQKTKGPCLSTAWHLITHQSLKRVPPDQDGMTLCLLDTVEKDETGETVGWVVCRKSICLSLLPSVSSPKFLWAGSGI